MITVTAVMVLMVAFGRGPSHTMNGLVEEEFCSQIIVLRGLKASVILAAYPSFLGRHKEKWVLERADFGSKPWKGRNVTKL